MSLTTVPRRRRLALLLTGCLTAAMGGVLTDAAVAGPPLPTPVTISVDLVRSDVTLPSGLPDSGKPSVVVAVGGTIHVDVSFHDATGGDAAFNKDTTLTLSSNVGTLSSSTGTALKGKSSATIDTSFTTAVNQVVLTVSGGSGPKAPSPGSSYLPPDKDLRFDVLSELRNDLPSTDGTAFEDGIGGDTGCTNATSSAPVCGTLVLPRGSRANVVLAVGACDTSPDSAYAPCYVGPNGPGGAVVQALFAQPTTAYTPESPATIIVRCDKTLCGTGAIQDLTVIYSLAGNGALTPALACPAKNTMAQAGVPCVDYVQSKRDGSGDTYLYLLTDQDIRTGIG
ncbi:MAG TPA: hypothetical protein VHO29_15550 [Marmoricola sp.]|nr:hypothetical protein [Marmoricola sp.]